MLKVKIAFIEIFVDVSFSMYLISIRCRPQGTFKDLAKKVEIADRRTTSELGKVTFAMGERVFDLEQDRGPLQGITIHSLYPLYRTG